VTQLADNNKLDSNETLSSLDIPYAITLQCTLAREGLRVVASFDPRIAGPWLVEKMLGQFGYAMQQLAAACKDTVVGSIDMLTPADYKVLWEWNREVPMAVERRIHEVFAEQACARPEAPAICGWDGELTYEELESLSTRLAHHLVELGVVPEMVVPLYFEKSMWTTVAILGVLKASGAFLLLDPLLPAARLEMLCRKIHATIGVASRSCQVAFQDLQAVSASVILDSVYVSQLLFLLDLQMLRYIPITQPMWFSLQAVQASPKAAGWSIGHLARLLSRMNLHGESTRKPEPYSSQRTASLEL
jgi:non-ribosomal peptide synthetase component F